MNCGLKSKTFNLLGTPNVSPGVAIETALETKARLIGVFMSVTGSGTASFALFATVGGVDIAIANGNVTSPMTNRSWWAGINQNNNVAVIQAAPAADTTNGIWPLCAPPKWVDTISGAVFDLKLLVETTLGGSVTVLYTVDPPTNAGEVM